jgi:ATP-dependent Clp protease adaptor protein ClpS
MIHAAIKELTREDSDTLLDELTGFSSKLIVHNDDVNTFEWIIISLVEICKHTRYQAEQCALIIHTKGKYAVKEGDFDVLKPMKDALTERGIGATIE